MNKTIKIKLQYFKQNSGKYYSDGEYQTTKKEFYEMVDEVRQLKRDGKLPGLVEGAREFTIYIDPVEPWNLPHMIY